MNHKQLTLAVFGTGRIGAVHARNAAAQPGVAVKYLVDPIESEARRAIALHSGAAIVDAGTVFSDPDVDGVIVASSTDTHTDLLLQAARAGKAVFCEKPVSLEFAQVVRVASMIRESGIPCMLGFQRRYDPNFRLVRERIAQGASGNLEQIIMTTRDPSPPPVEYVKRSGGLFRDQAIHDFDMARFLLGEEIATVYAVGGCLIDPAIGEAGDIDTAMITLKSVSGRFVQMNNCRRAAFGYDQRLEAVCSREVLSVGNSPQHSVTVADAKGFTAAPPENYFIERFAEAYRLEMAAFIGMLRNGTKPLAGIEEGLEAQRLAEAAQLSLESGQPVAIYPDWMPVRDQIAMH
ncbi:inositol 2-dehydrogenase [Marinobacterium nitratireducens]|uniref:Inositol 2-dehydrogenase n=1 Tax=Marinobacterium nitratireducens TaxID=518897 RepID=A0A917ZLE6_9GAMM|nr:inositol 2-dehydrogenase [Marinobacterium nitratireducens]GGO84487.1 inositol 2-dehydrogenase [Marinobacterium nitratireducens]